LLAFSAANASEFRTPWLGDRGPIRYRFDRLRTTKWNVNTYTSFNRKQAEKSYLKHGFDTEPLTALFFNKADFNLNEIFPNNLTPAANYFDTQEYSPFFTTFQFSPRAYYIETGMNFGGRIDYPVWCNNGRIGIRANVPFRCVEIERKDITDPNEDPRSQVIDERLITNDKNSNGETQDDRPQIVARAYRADYVAGLPGTNLESIVQGDNQQLTILGQRVARSKTVNNAPHDTDKAGATVTLVNTDATSGRPQLHAWSWTSQADDQALDGDTTAAGDVFQVGNKGNRFAQRVGSNNIVSVDPAVALATNKIGFFATDDTKDYTKYQDTLAGKGGSNLWFIAHRQTDSPNPEQFGNGRADTAGNGATIWRSLEDLTNLYDENPMNFLLRNGFDFASQKRSGMGDIDVDVFYEHDFNCEWRGEVSLGVRFPTGGKQKTDHNPYRPNLGNGGHWEIKLAALVAWHPVYWMNMKLDLAYSFALEGRENRGASFKGANVKNIGPSVRADVDYGYFVGNFDLTFFHPKTCKLATTLGYQLYYKTEDHISYKVKSLESWLGHKADGKTANAYDLDSGVARRHTEAVGHKVRSETSFFISKWFEVFAGASFTFAGQNVARDKDIHAGWNVRF